MPYIPDFVLPSLSSPPSFDKYRATRGEIDRCHIACTDVNHMFAGAKVHFKEPKLFLCKTEDGQNPKRCCQVLGQARWRLATVLVKYHTNRKGFIVNPFRYSLHPWIFGEATYERLKNLHKSSSLTDCDFFVDCLNEDFQHLALRPCESSLWKKELNDGAKTDIEAVFQFGKTHLGVSLSQQEINVLLDGGNTGVQVQTQTPEKIETPEAPRITLITGRRRIQMDDLDLIS
jgi:hypothetical protein